MESSKSVGSSKSKIPPKAMAGGAALKKSAEKDSKDDKKEDKKLTEDEKKTIDDLKKIYLETIKLDVKLQHEIYNLEKSFESKHNELFDRRLKILSDFRKKSIGGDAANSSSVRNFWLKVLKSSYTEFISKRDEKMLTYLTDIRVKLYNEPEVKFIIEFSFEANEFFTNNILTKTYFLNCLPDADDPLTFDGAEIFKCEGCEIDWKIKPEKNPKTSRLNFTSFFDFFNPPTLPDDPEHPTYCDINAILQNDFELGFYLKERVISKAVMFFTGEIADCQSTDSESDDDEDDSEDEDDDDDEDDETNESNDNDTSGNDADSKK